ncbi:MAG: biotin/lipoyl-binding protein [Kiritimatiellae bacterium]|nr:biotin/lipoyl-binding protein [Kiritimatiellia bacterium]
MIGQGIVLMVAGMVIVYAFLYLLIVVSHYSSRLVSRFDYLVADCEPKKQNRKQKSSAVAQSDAAPPKGSTPVTAPVPGSVLRISVSEGQTVAKDDEILVLDVMKMETPITAPCAGRVSIRVAVMDKVSTGDTLATIG